MCRNLGYRLQSRSGSEGIIEEVRAQECGSSAGQLIL